MADLFVLSNEREAYRDGYVVSEISTEPGNEFVGFRNGRVLRRGEEQGGIREDLMKVQIKNTIRKHLEKECQVEDKGILRGGNASRRYPSSKMTRDFHKQ
jgi:type III restriction enzyme